MDRAIAIAIAMVIHNVHNFDYFRNSQKMVLNIKERLPLVISCSYNIIKTPGTVSCYVNNYSMFIRKLLPPNFKFCVPSATLGKYTCKTQQSMYLCLKLKFINKNEGNMQNNLFIV